MGSVRPEAQDPDFHPWPLCVNDALVLFLVNKYICLKDRTYIDIWGWIVVHLVEHTSYPAQGPKLADARRRRT